MNSIEEGISIPVKADISAFTDAITDMQSQSKKFGSVFSGTLKSAVLSGKSFEDTLKSLALRLSDMALSAGLKPLEQAASGLFENLIGSFGTGGSGSSILPFAKGGVVSSPTYFNAGSSLGLMGEAGAEAIMPLARGSDGRLGVRTSSGESPVNIVFNVSSPDVQGFRRSEAQISAMLAKTVGRGRRSL